ncbi:MAG TPA: cupin domain-containing protein [Gemmatimonadales bacterium]
MHADPHHPLPTRAPTADPADLAASFARDGFFGPFRLFTAAECERIAGYLSREDHPPAPDWHKGRAATERFLYELATTPALLRLVTALLGEHVVLWGVAGVRRRPGAVHPWHSDIESCDPEGRFVSAWIGIEHTSRESALQLLTRSHRMGMTVQEARHARGWPREGTDPERMLALVRETEPEAALVQPDMTNGDALLFDGRLWHGSDNTRKEGRRLALLLQYAAADQPVRIPDPTRRDWPFRSFSTPLPPVILVSGSGNGGGVNRLVPPPAPDGAVRPAVSTVIHRFVLPAAPEEPWTRVPAFRGPTRTLARMACHASVLAPGHSPHLPHAHGDEELLIPLRGDVELVIARAPDDPAPKIEPLGPGAFVYYAAGQHHTIRNSGTEPAAYVMFRWHGPPVEGGPAMDTAIVRYVQEPADAGQAATRRQALLRGPTGCLGQLRSHLTVLQPGAGYEPHVDAYDVGIVLLSGRVETLGEEVAPPAVVYYAAGEPHGMRNVGDEPARYLVFEFRGPGASRPAPASSLLTRLASRVRRLAGRWAPSGLTRG